MLKAPLRNRRASSGYSLAMRRSLTLLALAVAACGRSQPIDLPVCAGGQPLEPEAKHVMSIGARGRVEIDRAWCETEDDVKSKLETVARSMPSNDSLAYRSGYVYVPDEPLVVRIDASTRFLHAAKWLCEAQASRRIYRTRVAVRDRESGDELYLPIYYELLGRGCVEFPLDPNWKAEHDRVQLMLIASPNVQSETWNAMWWRDPQQTGEWKASSWAEIREKLEAIPHYERDIVIRATLPADTPWGVVTGITADALRVAHPEIEFTYYEGEPPTSR